MVDIIRVAMLLAATITMGLMAGLFAAFAYSVMPGLARTDDRTMVSAMQAINVASLNPLFALLFFGAFVFTGIAAALQLGREPLTWVTAALVCYLATLGITFGINIPLNNQLGAATDPDSYPAARRRFEARWVRWNVVRSLTCLAGFGCLVWALVVHGQVTGS